MTSLTAIIGQQSFCGHVCAAVRVRGLVLQAIHLNNGTWCAVLEAMLRFAAWGHAANYPLGDQSLRVVRCWMQVNEGQCVLSPAGGPPLRASAGSALSTGLSVVRPRGDSSRLSARAFSEGIQPTRTSCLEPLGPPPDSIFV